MLDRLVVTMIGYALGSIPTGYLVLRWRTGDDIRTLGGGSTGGRNVARQLGPAWGYVSGAGDVAKGAAAVALARRLAARSWPFAMLGAVVGHVWPVTLGFRGGRGIAPALGAVITGDPAIGGAVLGTFAAAWTATHASRPAIVAAIAVVPVSAVILRRSPETVAGILASIAVIAAGHRPKSRRDGLPADAPHVAGRPP